MKKAKWSDPLMFKFFKGAYEDVSNSIGLQKLLQYEMNKRTTIDSILVAPQFLYDLHLLN